MHARLFVAALASAALCLAVVVPMSPTQAATNLNSSRSNIYRAVASDADRAACTQGGGRIVVQNGNTLCETAQTGQTGSGPQEGITINGCAPSASGDPLKGLNVSKGGTSSGGQLCP